MHTIISLSKALSDKNRLRILMALHEKGELCACHLTELLSIAPPTVSRHMNVLKTGGLIEERKEGRWVFYRPVSPSGESFLTTINTWIRKELCKDTIILSDIKKLREITACDHETFCKNYEMKRELEMHGFSSLPRQRLLFLCTTNSCRSQIAEGWTRHLKGMVLEAYSAGVHPEVVDPFTIEIMQEVGVDISNQRPKHIDTMSAIAFDYVITLCGHAEELGSVFPGHVQVIHKDFDDPSFLAEQFTDAEDKRNCYRHVRDEIRQYVESLPGSLTAKHILGQ